MLPPIVIKRLDDHFGAYTIHVTCKKCRHAREIDPHVLARLYGWYAQLEKVSARFRCSGCQTRSVEVEIGFNKKRPRGNNNE